ncbi:hypothetical protein [Micromonospora inyonensis]|uniref:Secreted protein n=1 Tax=Micromonospora inyonensis TaxID=47866 RepID=A0A1C6SNL6_9ACTN|nr:hypothetical protein [Micromonospora inyonensis]SCL31048.1 hypothetical protein GA0074694_5869 [Micromonospora inyonensis]
MNRRIHPLAAVTGLIALLAPGLAAPGAAHAQPGSAPGRAARDCTPIRPETDFYAGGRVATVLLAVPDDPTCTTISVSHVVDVAVPTDRCQDFLVIFYPTDGSEPIATEPVTACSHGPRSRPVVLATDVPDGTWYRVLYEIDYLGQDVRFTVRH